MRTTKMHRVILYVMDLGNEHTHESLTSELKSIKYPEFVTVGEIKTTDIGEWHDDHPLNFKGADHEIYFKSPLEKLLDSNDKAQWETCKHGTPFRYSCEECEAEG